LFVVKKTFNASTARPLDFGRCYGCMEDSVFNTQFDIFGMGPTCTFFVLDGSLDCGYVANPILTYSTHESPIFFSEDISLVVRTPAMVRASYYL